MTNRICSECHAYLLHVAEYHPYEYCMIAKIFPNDWKERIKRIIDNGDKFETHVGTGFKLEAPNYKLTRQTAKND